MKKINITTPENIEVEYTLADLGSRTAAAVIDMLIQGVLFVALIIAVALIANFSSDFWEEYYGWIIGIALLVYSLISYGYFIILELTMNGRTLGKKVLKLRTIRSNGQPVSLRHSAIRNLFRVFIDVFGIGVVFIFFSKQRRRVGDYAASTIVISEESRTRPVTLEDLQGMHENLGYYISEEEYDLLREYFGRRDTIADCSELREELKQHFTKKFEALGILEEWEDFIKEL